MLTIPIVLLAALGCWPLRKLLQQRNLADFFKVMVGMVVGVSLVALKLAEVAIPNPTEAIVFLFGPVSAYLKHILGG